MTYSREELIAKARDIAQLFGTRRITRKQFETVAQISSNAVHRHFDTYSDLLKAAGLEAPKNSRVADDVMLRALLEAIQTAGGQTQTTRLMRFLTYHQEVYARRYGFWRCALYQAGQWAKTHWPDFPYLDRLPATDPANPAATTNEPAVVPCQPRIRNCGPLLNYRGMLHAPVNELGVVLLFGMLAEELGFLVETVAQGFPDCEAKRRVKHPAQGWSPVRIEFEYVSGNFREHGHEPSLCDLIVCWEHTWKDSPLEVLELKSVLAKMSEPRAA